jgi:hypothetical protein
MDPLSCKELYLAQCHMAKIVFDPATLDPKIMPSIPTKIAMEKWTDES